MAASFISKNLNLSIVIVSYNDEESLKECLNSIYAHGHGLALKIIVVNNACLLPINFKKQFPNIYWIENNQNFGFAKAVNQGIKAAKTEYILCLNSDTILLKNSLVPLVRFMDEYKKAGAAGGRVLNPQGQIQPNCRRFPIYLNGLFNRTSLLTKIFPNNRFSSRYLLSRWDHKNIRRVDWVAGTYIVFRQETIQDMGYLDEDYFMYCEEIDWCFRAKQKGWKVYYVPEAEIIHHHKNTMHAKRKVILHHKSMLMFYRKHLETPFAIYIFIAACVYLKLIGWFLLYDLGRAFRVLHKTRKVSRKLSVIND